MSSRTLSALVGIALAVLPGVRPLAAAPPTEDAIRRARELDARAVVASKKGDRLGAVELWSQAERLHPLWRYAFNQATHLRALERFTDAWAACERASAQRPPQAQRALVTELRGQLESILLRTYAFVELIVTPPDASVTIDGKIWPAPRRGWTAHPTSTLYVTAAGYAPYRGRWEHPIGKRHVLRLTLTPVGGPGRGPGRVVPD